MSPKNMFDDVISPKKSTLSKSPKGNMFDDVAMTMQKPLLSSTTPKSKPVKNMFDDFLGDKKITATLPDGQKQLISEKEAKELKQRKSDITEMAGHEFKWQQLAKEKGKEYVSKAWEGIKGQLGEESFLQRALAPLQIAYYPIVNTAEALINPNKNWADAALAPFKGVARAGTAMLPIPTSWYNEIKNRLGPTHTFKDVLIHTGRFADRAGEIDKVDVLGLSMDILLDPATWVSFGTTLAPKIGIKAGETGLHLLPKFAKMGELGVTQIPKVLTKELLPITGKIGIKAGEEGLLGLPKFVKTTKIGGRIGGQLVEEGTQQVPKGLTKGTFYKRAGDLAEQAELGERAFVTFKLPWLMKEPKVLAKGTTIYKGLDKALPAIRMAPVIRTLRYLTQSTEKYNLKNLLKPGDYEYTMNLAKAAKSRQRVAMEELGDAINTIHVEQEIPIMKQLVLKTPKEQYQFHDTMWRIENEIRIATRTPTKYDEANKLLSWQKIKSKLDEVEGFTDEAALDINSVAFKEKTEMLFDDLLEAHKMPDHLKKLARDQYVVSGKMHNLYRSVGAFADTPNIPGYMKHIPVPIEALGVQMMKHRAWLKARPMERIFTGFLPSFPTEKTLNMARNGKLPSIVLKGGDKLLGAANQALKQVGLPSTMQRTIPTMSQAIKQGIIYDTNPSYGLWQYGLEVLKARYSADMMNIFKRLPDVKTRHLDDYEQWAGKWKIVDPTGKTQRSIWTPNGTMKFVIGEFLGKSKAQMDQLVHELSEAELSSINKAMKVRDELEWLPKTQDVMDQYTKQVPIPTHKNIVVYEMPKDMADMLNKFWVTAKPDNIETARRWAQWLGAGWKAQATVAQPNIGFFARNIMGAVFNNMFEGVGLRDYIKAISQVVKHGNNMIKAKRTGNINEILKARAAMPEAMREYVQHTGAGHFVKSEFIQEGVDGLKALQNQGMEMLKKGLGSTVGAVVPLPGLTVKGLHVKAGRWINEQVEMIVRLAHFIKKRDEGFDALESAASVRKYQYDYDELSEVEKHIRDFAIPFYTWTRKTIPLMLEMAGRKPGKFSAVPKALDMLARESGETPKEKAMRPGYFSTLGAIPIPKQVATFLGFLGPNTKYLNPNFPMQDLSRLNFVVDFVNGRFGEAITTALQAGEQQLTPSVRAAIYFRYNLDRYQNKIKYGSTYPVPQEWLRIPGMRNFFEMAGANWGQNEKQGMLFFDKKVLQAMTAMLPALMKMDQRVQPHKEHFLEYFEGEPDANRKAAIMEEKEWSKKLSNMLGIKILVTDPEEEEDRYIQRMLSMESSILSDHEKQGIKFEPRPTTKAKAFKDETQDYNTQYAIENYKSMFGIMPDDNFFKTYTIEVKKDREKKVDRNKRLKEEFNVYKEFLPTP